MTRRREERQLGADAFAGVTFRGVDSDTWDDLVHLFTARGGPKYCWCMVWRTMPPGESRSDRDAKRSALEECVRDGVPSAYLDTLTASR